MLHSRSGVDRNRDYREAFQTLMAKLDAASIAYDIYLDSRPVRHLPLANRRLAFSRQAPLPQRFNTLVKAMNEGSSSSGAWRRVLFTAPGHTGVSLAAVVNGSDSPTPQRLPAEQLRKVTYEHVDEAVRQLLGGEDAPAFDASRDYDLIAPDGARLAPKKVFGLALERALGIAACPDQHLTLSWGWDATRRATCSGSPALNERRLFGLGAPKRLGRDPPFRVRRYLNDRRLSGSAADTANDRHGAQSCQAEKRPNTSRPGYRLAIPKAAADCIR